MEREIKFRGRTKDGEWLKGNLVQFNGMCSIVSNKTVEETPLDYVGAAIVQGIVDKDTVGEYTGCKDIDGEEIYEGDILYDIMYRYECFVRNRDLAWRADYGVECFYMSDKTTCYEYRVIGNKWENPELMRGYKK